ncbi:MAG: FtsW/RodA/SpoVE family cell cycle protein [Patescibacteria group bacterium]
MSSRKVFAVDKTLAAITGILVAAGMLIFLSASFGLLAKEGLQFESALLTQLVLGLGGGLLVGTAVLYIPFKAFRKYAHILFGLGLLLTLAVFIPGIGLSANGATRWLDLRFTTVQPVEFLKIGYVLFLASWLAAGKGRAASLYEGIVPFGVITALVGIALLLQPDTDTFLIIAASGFAMMFAAGMRWRDLAIGACIGLLLVGLLIAARPYLLERVKTYLNPGRDPQGAGYQIQQSLIAVGSGELFGRGFGQSVQKFNYLPEARSDSIFAVYAEEFGFFGSILLVLGFLGFAMRGFWVAARTPDLFSGLTVVGLVTLIAAQAFLNIAAMVGLAPVGGLPLVFVSHGGTALMLALVMVALILSASRTVRR